MRTEKEAKETWCPHSRAPLPMGGTVNRPAGEENYNRVRENTRCLASGCGVWDWDWGQVVGEFMEEHGGHPENRRGRCGLVNSFLGGR